MLWTLYLIQFPHEYHSIISIIFFYKWGKWNTEMLSKSLKETQLISTSFGIPTQFRWLQSYASTTQLPFGSSTLIQSLSSPEYIIEPLNIQSNRVPTTSSLPHNFILFSSLHLPPSEIPSVARLILLSFSYRNVNYTAAMILFISPLLYPQSLLYCLRHRRYSMIFLKEWMFQGASIRCSSNLLHVWGSSCPYLFSVPSPVSMIYLY